MGQFALYLISSYKANNSNVLQNLRNVICLCKNVELFRSLNFFYRFRTRALSVIDRNYSDYTIRLSYIEHGFKLILKAPLLNTKFSAIHFNRLRHSDKVQKSNAQKISKNLIEYIITFN